MLYSYALYLFVTSSPKMPLFETAFLKQLPLMLCFTNYSYVLYLFITPSPKMPLFETAFLKLHPSCYALQLCIVFVHNPFTKDAPLCDHFSETAPFMSYVFYVIPSSKITH